MAITSIQLESGYTIFIEGIYCQPTYAGVLAGTPSKEDNLEVLEVIKSYVTRIWSHFPIAIIQPKISNSLPQFTVAASTFLTQPVNDSNMDAAGLIVVWFTDELPNLTDTSFWEPVISFSWSSHAKDFVW